MFIERSGLVVNDGSYVQGRDSFGPAGVGMSGVGWEPNLRRPFIDARGRRCCTINTGRTVLDNKTGKHLPEIKSYTIEALRAKGIDSPVFNATSLTRDAWIQIDEAIVRATRQRLRAWADLAGTNPRGGFDAMSKMTLEYHSMNDPGEAVVDMDARNDGRNDRPQFILSSIPLPITHCDFSYSERELAVARNSRAPLDTTGIEWATRRVLETVEQTVIGTVTGMTYGTQASGYVAHTGTSSVWGYTNFPYRVTKTDLNTPTSANPEKVVEDVLEMRETMRTNGFFGPYVVYHSTSYDRFLDDDYFRTGGTAVTRTLRERIEAIEDVVALRRLDYLTSGYQLVMIQMTREVAEAIVGMQPTPLQWESKGGLEVSFKILAILVPLLKKPYNTVSGIIHATTS